MTDRRAERGKAAIDPEETAEEFAATASTQPTSVAQLAGALAGARGWKRRLEGARVHGAWPEIAGARLAAHTEPVRLLGGVLVLRVDSSAWAAEVRALSGGVVRRANEVLGAGTVVTLRVTTDTARRHQDGKPL